MWAKNAVVEPVTIMELRERAREERVTTISFGDSLLVIALTGPEEPTKESGSYSRLRGRWFGLAIQLFRD